MVRILRVVSVSRGLDPRDFSLVAFGGAGPLHAADLAAELGIPKIVVPEAPGLFSALGLLWADLRADFSGTARRAVTPANVSELQALLDRLESEATAWLDRERVPGERRRLLRSADMRYPLQNYEINLRLPDGAVDADWLARTTEAFHAAHERLYSYRDPDAPAQLVNLRIAAVGRTERPQPAAAPLAAASPAEALKASRPVHFQGAADYVCCPIYDRDRLRPGNRIRGPAVVEQADSTILVPPGFTASVDPHARLVLGFDA